MDDLRIQCQRSSEAFTAPQIAEATGSAPRLEVRNAAAFLDQLDQIDTLEVGKLADIVMVDGDPLTDVTALVRVKLVLLGVISRSNVDFMNRTLVLLAVASASLLGRPVVAQDKPTVAVIGTGTLAGVLGPAIGQQGYDVIYGSRDPERETVRSLVARSGANASAATQAEAAAQADIVILAVPSEVLEEVAGNLGPLSGKVIVDVSGGRKRVAADGYLELVPDSAFSERIQTSHSDSRVVRINLPNMILFLNPLLLGTRPTVLIAGNDPRARAVVAQLVFDTGMDPWDAGPLRFARVFDAINVMNLVPAQQGRMEGYELKLLPSIPFSCFFDMSELFGFGRPYDMADLPAFPRRDPVIPCDEWLRRAGLGDQRQ